MSVGADPIPPERALLVRDGSTVDIGDRTLTAQAAAAVRQPGARSRSSTRARASCSARTASARRCRDGGRRARRRRRRRSPTTAPRSAQLLWGSVDSPWVHKVQPTTFAESLAQFVEGKPAAVLSTHLPPIRSGLDRYVETLTMLPASSLVRDPRPGRRSRRSWRGCTGLSREAAGQSGSAAPTRGNPAPGTGAALADPSTSITSPPGAVAT